MSSAQSSAGRAARRRRGAGLAALGAAALLLTTCSGGSADDKASGSSSAPTGPVTLTFVNAQDPGTFDKVIAGFKKTHPNITIKQQVVPFDDLNTTVQSRLQSKDPGIDLYDVDEPRLAAFAVRGYLADLGDLGSQ